jgi:hypothetical protein
MEKIKEIIWTQKFEQDFKKNQKQGDSRKTGETDKENYRGPQFRKAFAIRLEGRMVDIR